MEIDDAKEALILLLEIYPIAQCSEIISEMDIAGGLYAAEDSLHLVLRTQKN